MRGMRGSAILFLIICVVSAACVPSAAQQIRLGIDTQGTLPVTQGGTNRTTICPVGGLMQSDGSIYGCVSLAFSNFTGIADRTQLPSTVAYEDEANTFSLTQSFSTIGLGDITCESTAGITNCRDNSIGTGNTLLNIRPGDNDSGLDPVFCVGSQIDCTSTQDFQFTANGTFRLTDSGTVITPATITMPSTGEFEWGSSVLSSPDVQIHRVGTETLGVSLPSSPSTRADLEVRNINTSLVEFNESAGDPTCIAGNYNVKGNSTSGTLRGCENGTLFSLNSSSSAYSTVEDENTPLTQRSTLNFEGSGITCADDTSKTTCTVSSGGSATVTTSVFASIPACATEGDIWFQDADEGPLSAVCDGTNWKYSAYGLSNITPPPQTGWTDEFSNLTESVVGVINLTRAASSGSGFSLYSRPVPSDPTVTPYFVELCVAHPFGVTISGGAIADPAVDDGTVATYATNSGEYVFTGRYTDLSTGGGATALYSAIQVMSRISCFGIEETATNRIIYDGPHGSNMTLVHSEGRTTGYTATDIAVTINSLNSSNAQTIQLFHYRVR